MTENMTSVTIQIKLGDYGLGICAFCVKLRYIIYVQRLGQASDAFGDGRGGRRPLIPFLEVDSFKMRGGPHFKMYIS